MVSLYSPAIESNVLAILLKHPEVWAEFDLVRRSDFSEVHQPLFDIIKVALDSTPQQSVVPLMLSERLKANGVTKLAAGIEPFDYLEGLTNRFVDKAEAKTLAQELKRLTVRRELVDRLDTAKSNLLTKGNASFEEMTNLVEKELSSVTTSYYKPDTTEVFGDGLIYAVEDKAANPVKPEDMLYMGPFESINRTVGPAIFPGSFSVLIARTGNSKTSLSFFWCVYTAERYNLPILWLDAAEMTVEQLQMRAVCALSGGRIPLWAVRSGEWDKRPEMRKIVRNEIWPRVKKLKMTYKNVGGMSGKEKVSFIRRFAYNKVGRGNFFIIADDYLKGIEALGDGSSEWQAMGYYVGDVKTLVTDELQAGYWTSLQGNRTMVTQGKKAHEIMDSGETGASISDRIIQQATTAWLQRYKIPEEMAREKDMFGNMLLKRAKLREGYGREYEKIARPIRLDNGQMVENYWNIHSHNFSFADRGLYSEALEVLGRGKVDLTKPGAVPPVSSL